MGAATEAAAHLPPIAASGFLWWAAAFLALAAGAVGTWQARQPRDKFVFLMPLVVGLSVGVPYVFMMRYAQLRFLLPSVGLLVIALAVGLLAIGGVRRPLPRAVGPLVAAAIVLSLVGVQVLHARTFRSGLMRSDRAESAVVTALKAAGVTGPCAIAGDSALNIAYQVGCDVLGPISPSAPNPPGTITTAQARGDQVAVVLRQAASAGGFLDAGASYRSRSPS